VNPYNPLSGRPPQENQSIPDTPNGAADADLRVQKTIVIALIGAVLTVVLIVGIGIGTREMKSVQAMRHFHRGTDQYKRKEYAAAEKELREAVRLKPDDASYQSRLGDILYDEDKFLQAAVAYRTAVHLEPTNAYHHNYLGASLEADHKMKEAIVEYREAVRLDTEDTNYPTYLSHALTDTHQYAEAESAMREAIKRKSDDAELYAQLAVVLIRQKKPEKDAQVPATYKNAFRYAPDEGRYHRYLANFYKHGKRYADAVAEAHTAVRLEPDSAASHDSLSSSLYHLHQLPEARAEILEAIRLDGKKGDYFGHMGAIDRDRREFALAETDYRRAAQLDLAEPYYHTALANVLRLRGRAKEARLEDSRAKTLETQTASDPKTSNR